MHEPQKDIHSVCLVVNLYPNALQPVRGTFLKVLVETLADSGIEVTVIQPLQVTIYPHLRELPYKLEERTPGGNIVTVYRPKVIGLSEKRRLGLKPVRISTHFMEKAALSVIRRNGLKPDVLYGHFLAPSGVAVARLSRKLGIPSICAMGESNFTIEQFGAAALRKELTSLTGSIAVSSFIRDYVLATKVLPKEKIRVFPNGFSPERFFPMEKSVAREMLGLDQDKFIVGFAGLFNSRKGIRRVEEAVDALDDVYFIAAGYGKQNPTSERCLLQRRFEHGELNLFYNAIDAFVLPTLREGCPNVVIEAMGCGVPVISSNLGFNDDILDESFSIRIDPNSVAEIAAAIAELRDDPAKLRRMGDAAFAHSAEFHINDRVKRILDYMQFVVTARQNTAGV